MLRKRGLIFLGMSVSLLLATQVGSAILSEKMTTCYPSEFLEKENAYEAWIAIEYKGPYLKIRVFCFNNTSEDEVLRYKLEAKKSDKMLSPSKLNSFPVETFLKSRCVFCHLINYVRLFSCNQHKILI